MIILALDTALHQCSSAIVNYLPANKRAADEGFEVLAYENLQIQSKADRQCDDKRAVVDKVRGQVAGHGEAIGPMVARLFKDAQLSVKDIHRLVLTIGPGGFTGVRVGLGFARGLALGQDFDVVGVSSLTALAASAPRNMLCKEEFIAPLIDARRSEIYGALYKRDQNGMLTEYLSPFVGAPETIVARLLKQENIKEGAALTLVGSGASLVDIPASKQVLFSGGQQSHTQKIDVLALARYGMHLPAKPHMPSPLYLRAPDAKPSAKSLFAQLGPDVRS